MQPTTILLPGGDTVSGLLLSPPGPVACCYVMAHGAGAGMQHAFMAGIADGLADRGIATLRFQFPAMEQGKKRPDRPEVAQAAIRAAVATAAALQPGLPLLAGGKSFGGRMTSQAQAASPLPGVRGLVFWGFPLHPAGKPGISRAAHLDTVAVPMLFLQGTNDALADISLLQPVIAGLGTLATLAVAEGADHAFHVPRRSGTTDGQVMTNLLNTMAAWSRDLLCLPPPQSPTLGP